MIGDNDSYELDSDKAAENCDLSPREKSFDNDSACVDSSFDASSNSCQELGLAMANSLEEDIKLTKERRISKQDFDLTIDMYQGRPNDLLERNDDDSFFENLDLLADLDLSNLEDDTNDNSGINSSGNTSGLTYAK